MLPGQGGSLNRSVPQADQWFVEQAHGQRAAGHVEGGDHRAGQVPGDFEATAIEHASGGVDSTAPTSPRHAGRHDYEALPAVIFARGALLIAGQIAEGARACVRLFLGGCLNTQTTLEATCSSPR
jgi:hypothetical protein